MVGAVRLFVLARHAESVLNLERRINADPARDVRLTERGEAEARLLGRQLANVALDACVHTRLPRTRRTAAIALAGRGVPLVVESDLDDVDVGDLDGAPIERYHEWRREHGRRVPFPGGESLDDAARRYAAAYRRLLEGPYDRVLVVFHELPLRYALNAAAGSEELERPVGEIANAVPFLLDENALSRAAERIAALAR